MRILVTGASGFIGAGVVSHLLGDPNHQVVAASRRTPSQVPSRVETLVGCALAPDTEWRAAIGGVDAVIHLAARVHVMKETANDALAEYRRVNVAGSSQLARQAAAVGVRRFVYVSSIKVYGESTVPARPFRADDPPAPVDPYGTSKLEAELALRDVAAATGMELVIVRPPLVYGPGVRANFLNMMSWLHRGLPLPLGAIHNRRSLIALDNLCDLIVACVERPAAAGETFLASDGEDVSTTELLERLAVALGRPARLVPVPIALLQTAFAVLGKRDIAQRLCGWLQVDIGATRRILGWSPPVRIDEALARTARWYLSQGPRA